MSLAFENSGKCIFADLFHHIPKNIHFLNSAKHRKRSHANSFLEDVYQNQWVAFEPHTFWKVRSWLLCLIRYEPTIGLMTFTILTFLSNPFRIVSTGKPYPDVKDNSRVFKITFFGILFCIRMILFRGLSLTMPVACSVIPIPLLSLLSASYKLGHPFHHFPFRNNGTEYHMEYMIGTKHFRWICKTLSVEMVMQLSYFINSHNRYTFITVGLLQNKSEYKQMIPLIYNCI